MERSPVVNQSDLIFNQYNFTKILKDIESERIRQDSKFGVTRRLTPTEWLPILIEEVGEFAMAICDESDYDHMREELIQIAALAVAIIQDLDEQSNDLDNWY